MTKERPSKYITIRIYWDLRTFSFSLATTTKTTSTKLKVCIDFKFSFGKLDCIVTEYSTEYSSNWRNTISKYRNQWNTFRGFYAHYTSVLSVARDFNHINRSLEKKIFIEFLFFVFQNFTALEGALFKESILEVKTPVAETHSRLPTLSVAKLIRQRRLKKIGREGGAGNLPPTLPANLSWNPLYNAPENYSFNWVHAGI